MGTSILHWRQQTFCVRHQYGSEWREEQRWFTGNVAAVLGFWPAPQLTCRGTSRSSTWWSHSGLIFYCFEAMIPTPATYLPVKLDCSLWGHAGLTGLSLFSSILPIHPYLPQYFDKGQVRKGKQIKITNCCTRPSSIQGSLSWVSVLKMFGLKLTEKPAIGV